MIVVCSYLRWVVRVLLGALSILLLAGCIDNQTESKKQPNILLILVDDLGNNDLASWGDGRAPTPTLNELSQQSVRFRQHYTDSSCSPSRAALLTGQHPIQIGFQPVGLGLSSDVYTLPKSLKELGYATYHIGKWHVGEALEYPDIQPDQHGFDRWFGMLNHFVLQGPDRTGHWPARRPTHINPWLQGSLEAPQQYTGYLDDLLTDRAIETMAQASREQPWFINLWLYSPHEPNQPSPEFSARFAETEEGQYFALLSQLDHNVKRVLQALDEQGLSDDTIVVFASDNGSQNLYRDSNYPLAGRKTDYRDGGLRSPLLLRWPGHYQNLDLSQISHITDIYPTLIELVGGEVPSGLTGRSLQPMLDGQELAPPKAYVWMSQDGVLGLPFGVHNFETGHSQSKNPWGKYFSEAIAGPIGSVVPATPVVELPLPRVLAVVRDAEAQLRRVPVSWTPATETSVGYLSGRDFQRAPVFAGLSFGLSLHNGRSLEQPQTLIEQPGIWQLEWLADGRLRLTHGEVVQLTEPVPQVNSCSRLVVSFDVKPLRTYPFPAPASTRTLVYWDGQTLLDSKRLLTRPATAEPLSNPTYVGARADGSAVFSGQIEPPVLLNKLLLEQQDGYSLSDLNAELCSANQGS